MTGETDNFVVNDDGTQMQNNHTGIDVDGNGLGHTTDDDFSSTDDSWGNDSLGDDW